MASNRPRLAPAVRLPPPFLELGIVLGSLLVGIVLLFAGLSVWSYIGVTAGGGLLAIALGVTRARRVGPLIEHMRRETAYAPWIEIAWPSWARKVFLAYLALVALSAVGLVLLALATALSERFG